MCTRLGIAKLLILGIAKFFRAIILKNIRERLLMKSNAHAL